MIYAYNNDLNKNIFNNVQTNLVSYYINIHYYEIIYHLIHNIYSYNSSTFKSINTHLSLSLGDEQKLIILIYLNI